MKKKKEKVHYLFQQEELIGDTSTSNLAWIFNLFSNETLIFYEYALDATKYMLISNLDLAGAASFD